MSKGHDMPEFESDGHVTLEMMIPGNKAGIVIGKGGETIKLLQVSNWKFGTLLVVVNEACELLDVTRHSWSCWITKL